MVFGYTMAITKKKRAQLAQEVLAGKYPELELQNHLLAETPWQLLVAVVLSAQSKDARVNMVTPHLFSLWPDAASLAKAPVEHVEEIIRPTGFFRNKAKNIVMAAQRVMTHYGGEVPKNLADLITLPGVARKTASVVLWGAFGINEGVAIDTHVGRIAFRLGLTKSKAPITVEKDLMVLFPQAEWGRVNHRMVSFGRDVCDARKPLCDTCEMQGFCPKVPWTSSKKSSKKN